MVYHSTSPLGYFFVGEMVIKDSLFEVGIELGRWSVKA
jgi:hypothetical protein